MSSYLRIPLFCGLVAALLTLPATPGLAQSQTVILGPGDEFTPPAVTINQGDTVTWDNAARGYHNVVFDDDSFQYPPTGLSSDPWVGSRRFMTPGTFTYHCHAHASPNVPGGMKGTVVVLAATTLTAVDARAPLAKLSMPKRQWVVLQRAVFATVELDEHATVVASATVFARGKKRPLAVASLREAVDAEADLHIRFRRQALRAIRRALRRGHRLTVRVTVTSRDDAGNSASISRSVRVMHRF